MKSFKIKTWFIALLVLGLVSCDNEAFFELTNPPEAPWQSLEELEKAPIGAYYCLSGNGGSRTMFVYGRMAGEAYADGMALASIEEGYPVQNDVEDMYNRDVEGKSIAIFDNAIFRNAYFAIGHANGALDFIAANDGVPFPEEGPDATNRIEGELRFVRAFAYYYLARIYAPAYPDDTPRLPFRTNQATNFDEAKTSTIASANDIYDFIVADLIEAKRLLPERYDATIHPEAYADGRANKFAAAALLAKVYFQMGMYDEALAEANFVIEENGGDYDLSEDPIEAFNKTGVSRGKEVIWYYALWAGDGLPSWKHPRRFDWYNATEQRATTPFNNTSRFMVASDAFLETAGWQDANGNETPEATEDLRYAQLFLRLSPEADSAFANTRDYVWNNRYFRAGDRETNLPVLRLADIVLLRAFLRAESGDNAGARADLNMVRNRAGLDDYAGSDGDLINAIHNERFKEMAFEGDRFWYLQGARVDIPAGDRGGSAIPWNSPLYSEIPDFEVELNDGF
ncbi:MAG: RagB/SusD family nutrient uptake outer membrane protein [bacterium]|nr:RagB/SusD family nutrient uptake outer membrane protein [bacterium]